MKRILLLFGAAAVLAISVSSCASTRDCQGHYHTRLANGVTL